MSVIHKVLITGSNGFLGQKLVDLLSMHADYKVFAISMHENDNPTIGNYDFQQMDLLDTEKLNDYLDQVKPDYIIHTAAITSVEACEADKEKCQRMNVDLVEQLASYCKREQAFLIQLSTDFIFDGQNGLYKEDDLAHPLSEYGKSKWRSEQVIQKSECAYAILRTILVYGINANPNRSNLVLWAKEKLTKQESIKVVNDQWRMPTFVDDLANACLLALEKRVTSVFHISGEEMLTIAEAVYQVADFWKLDKTLISEITAAEIGQSENRPRKTGFDLSKAKSILGYQPTSFKESLKIIETQYGIFRK
ncbi:SDR family oxidoreductase [Sphingobacterium sp. SRCM116780]|uniref:SDR family oxidoreductase n=1 Tax=Sphingobacterium sp. SRCM116780 TaxID=2907623 RepID=UPI001F178C30|nr:SDR family oxidoreductase [Sphingobacterium sp. SRCM116780]UIR55161.1 SDR family oxidoreductase [Sphingobacterium sp. SRCM116780]